MRRDALAEENQVAKIFQYIQSTIERVHVEFRSRLSEDCYEVYGMFLAWLAVESVLWAVNSLWTFIQAPKLGYALSVLMYGFVRWRLYVKALQPHGSVITKLQVDALVPYLWVFFLLQMCQLVDSYILHPIDIYNSGNGFIDRNRNLGNGAIRWLVVPIFYALKLLFLYSKTQCFRYIHTAKTHSL